MAMRLLVAVFLAWLALPAAAYAERDFARRSPPINTQGDITIAANSLLTCVDDESGSCANARNAVSGARGINNNERTMTWIDADGDPATFNSSAASLTLPTGARVLFAGLYYGGRLTAGSGGSPPRNSAARDTVLLRLRATRAIARSRRRRLTMPRPSTRASSM